MALLMTGTVAASGQCAKNATPLLISAPKSELGQIPDLDQLERYTSTISASNDKLVIGGSFYESGYAGIAQVDLKQNSVDFIETFTLAQGISALSIQASEDQDYEILALAAQDLHDETSQIFMLRLGSNGQ